MNPPLFIISETFDTAEGFRKTIVARQRVTGAALEVAQRPACVATEKRARVGFFARVFVMHQLITGTVLEVAAALRALRQ